LRRCTADISAPPRNSRAGGALRIGLPAPHAPAASPRAKIRARTCPPPGISSPAPHRRTAPNPLPAHLYRDKIPHNTGTLTRAAGQVNH
jgi:hypothetical protein